MARFKKGKSGNPQGRPEGSKNKNCMNPVFWFNMLEDCLAEVDKVARMPHVFRALELLMPKVNALPNTPGDSLDNARRLLGTIEPPSIPPPNAQTFDSTGVNGANGI